MKKIFYILFLFNIIFNINSADVSSDEKFKTLSIDEAVKLALVQNLDIKATEIGLDAQKWATATCWSIFIPSVTMSANITQLNESYFKGRYQYWLDYFKDTYGMDKDTAINNENFKNAIRTEVKGQVSVKLNLSWTFTAKMIFDVYDSVLNYNSSTISTDMTKKQIIKGVKESYYGLILERERINILNSGVESAKARYDITVKKLKADLVSELDKLNTEYDYEQKKVGVTEEENTYQNLLDSFKVLLGIKENIKIDLITPIELLNKYSFNDQKLINKFIYRNLELKSAINSLKSIQNGRNKYIAGLTPSITLSFLTDPTFIKPDPNVTDTNWFADVNHDWRDKDGYFTITATLPIDSWFPFSTYQKGIIDTTFSAQQQKLQIENTLLNKTNDVKSIIRDLKKINNILKSKEINLEIALKASKLAQLAFNAGQKLLIEVQEAENNAGNAYLDLLVSKVDYLKGLLDLAYNFDLTNEELINNLEVIKEKE